MFSFYEIEEMRETQEEHMMDMCIVQTFSRTYDSVGGEVETYTDGPETPCGLDQRPGFERHERDRTTVEYDATVRLPHDTVVDVKDRIKIIKRFGEPVTPFSYNVAGPIQAGPSGIRVLLRRILT